jgi:4-alpha-glucanotransferase
MRKNQIINQDGNRAAGLLLHISSLPGKYGIGNFGRSAYQFVDFLHDAGVKYWQVLPLVQTGFGDSPYQSVCCRSGNPYFIDPEILCEQNLLTKTELKVATLPAGRVDYGKLYETRYPLLRKAFSRFDTKNTAFKKFVKSEKFRDYAEYMTVKQLFGGRCFIDWEKDFRLHNTNTVEGYIATHQEEYLFWQWVQFEFFREWTELKKYAHQKGISIVGDIPLYMAYDSADVWAKPQLFKLDEDRRMTEVAGVPPDYFSATGQLWGNPLYDWEEQKKDGYAWWISRLHDALEMYDVVRVDHFRGLDRYYAIPAGNQDAVIGRWCDGPKAELFTLAKQKLGEMNIIAEDLGVLDDGVKKLLADTAYPGMKILLFAFENEENDYLPKNIGHNSVCYTGTHDNDTAVGYFKRLSPDMLRYVRGNIRTALQSRQLSLPLRGVKDMTTAIIHLLLECDACLSILPVQDLLYLDNSARMNTPATGENNWQFRLKSIPSDSVAEALSVLLKMYKRK